MSFDGVFIHSLLKTLRPTLVSGRLSKIYQPFNQDLILTFRQNRKNQQLLISANAQYPRLYLTNQAISNPDKAPVFVMVLRKYLEGSILLDIKQVGLERIVNFYFSNHNELGDVTKLVLSVELMGRHSNVILYDENNGQIIDLLKRINPDENRARLLLPKATYQLPPLNPGINGLKLTEEQFDTLKAQNPNPETLVKQINGLDGDNHHELLGYLNDDYSYGSFKLFFDHFASESPRIFVLKTPANKRKFFTYLPYHLNLAKENSDSNLNKSLDDFYEYQAKRDWVKQKAGKIERIIKNEQKKLTKKIKKLQKQQNQAENSEKYRISGEILNANLNSVKAGMTEITLPNYYQNNEPLKIKLDASLSPAHNAQKYFTRYKKLRVSIKHVAKQIKIAQDDLAYFDSVQTEINNADPQDIDQITEELINQGYLHKEQKSKKRKKTSEQDLNKFQLTSGKKVWVGKNNYQNDWLTFRKADKNDVWFHVKNMPGSHVILRDHDPSDTDIKETAEIASYFSKAKNSAHVQVDYVTAKRVKKPNGSKPGFVIYTGQNSIEVTPEESNILVKKIK